MRKGGLFCLYHPGILGNIGGIGKMNRLVGVGGIGGVYVMGGICTMGR